MPPSLSTLLTTLEMGDFQDRWEVAKVLPSYGEIALPSLLALLQADDEDWELRWFVTRILGEMAGPGVVEGLIAVLLQGTDSDLAETAALALGNCGEAAVTVLTPLLSHPTHKKLAVKALAQIRHPAALTPLLTVAQDEEDAVRLTVIEALGQFHGERVIPVLLTALQDSAAPVRRAAAIALGGSMATLPLETLEQELVPRLMDDALAVAEAVAITLGRSQTAVATASLERLLQAPQTPVPLKVVAAHCLGRQESDLALTALTQAWAGATDAVQLAIIAALERLGETHRKPTVQATFQAWLAALIGQNHAIGQKQAIALALGRLQTRSAIPLLQRLGQDAEESVQLHAAAALRMVQTELMV
ncbi:MAG TPA: HEAT repeat domain-containing protein [Leptolyngbyaceae cyanobacterium M65_K2018_010]|nr:HEAT repeat domain-containing protein [Leptolyngbyaceae cyanobacterium M65_K2018_010]